LLLFFKKEVLPFCSFAMTRNLAWLGSHAAHLLVEAMLGVAGIVMVAGCVLAWRLSQGPIDITSLVRREAPRLTLGRTHVTIGHAALAWEGFHDPDSPLDIRWRDLAIDAGPGVAPIALPQGRVSLSVSRLIVGQIVPRVIEVDAARLALTREQSGAMRLDFDAAANAQTTPNGAAEPGGGNAAGFLHDLVSPARPGGTSQGASGQGANGFAFLGHLRQLHVRGAVLRVHDLLLGTDWQANARRVDLDRRGDGRIDGQAEVGVASGTAQATMRAQASLTPDGTHISLTTSPVSPASLANLGAGLAGLSAVDAPVTVAMQADIGPDLALRSMSASAEAGAGKLHAGAGQVAMRDAAIELGAAPSAEGATIVTVRRMHLTLSPPPLSKGPAPTLSGHATVARDAAGVRADFALDLDHAAFADLPAYLPPGTGGGSRGWLVENITAGLATDGHVQGTLTAAADFTHPAVTALTGGMSATGLTVFWLRPVPPIEGANAKLVIEGPDSLVINIPTGTQGPIKLSEGRVRITGLSKKDQAGDISVRADGGLADTLALLNHPRLNLLSRRPITMQNPSGTVNATITVRMPLDARVTFESIAIAARAKLTGVHLGAVAAGRDLDQGDLSLAVDTDKLSVTGTGTVAAIPATLGVDMDFRDGPASQILEHITAKGTATPAQAAQAGLPGGIMSAGSAAVSADYTARRNGSGQVLLAANLHDAALSTPLGWTKQAGQDASASARLLLTKGALTGIDQLRASGPKLLIASHVEQVGGHLQVLRLDQVRIGQTAAAGSIAMPRAAADPLRVSLHGPKLDLSTYFQKRDADSAGEDDTRRGQPWAVDLKFDQVVLAKDEALNQVSLHASDDGLHVTDGQLLAGPNGQVKASITPLPAAVRGGASPGRALSVDASEAGAVLLAAGVADNIRGGRLRVNANYDDTQPHAPLTGTASLEQFRITNAPAIGRLLKAMTFYGAVDLLRGPGLGFQKAVVPFRWQQRVLTLNSARAFSASLGVTAKGDIDLRRHLADVSGTIVPAYFFNQLLGKIPLVGQLFSPEKGGGVFAARYAVRGKLADPKVSVNALSALTPGFLRNLFGG
jgi:hypothetical protein